MKVAWHLGLGDAIACAPIIAQLAKEADKVEVPCWQHNYVSVKSIFRNIPNVVVFTEKNDHAFSEYDYKLGVYNIKNPQRKDEDFVQWFYRQAKMNIESRHEHCPIMKAAKDTSQMDFDFPNGKAFSFVHQDIDRNLKIKFSNVSTSNWILGTKTDSSILSYVKCILKAKEIHCIDSSFLHLVEALNPSGKKIYHKYARPQSTEYKYLKNWEVKQ